ncbi:putative aminoadipate reductase [Mycena latifolia]|nr:putative aminoadipate reductase [Mycena latifolia]
MRIPESVALNCKKTPGSPFYVYGNPDSASDIVTITHLEFGRATHRAAHLVRPNHDGAECQVVGIIALSDTLLYQTIVVGLITAHLIPFPISPRNSPGAIVEMLRKTDCHRVIGTRVTLDSLFSAIQKELAQADPGYLLRIEEIPPLSHIFPNLGAERAECAFEPYPAFKTVPAFEDTCLYLHSSGSSGTPKVIAHSHQIVIQWTLLASVTDFRDSLPHPAAAMSYPPFHMSGFYGHILQPLCGIPVAIYPPIVTSPRELPIFPSADNILDHARRTDCKVMMTLPTVIATWSKNPEAIAYLKTYALVGWVGGPLAERLGNQLVRAGLNLRAGYGATECGPISAPLPSKGDELDWEWMQFSAGVKVRWAPQGDGTFECQVLNSENHTVSVENLVDVRGYATADLWINHPSKKHLWKIVGRIDDVIVHTSGEKTVPGPMENVVMSSPYVSGAVMFGRERDQAGILIEPVPGIQIDVEDAVQVTDLRNKLWPIIEEANQIAPAFSRIFKEMVLFTSPNKPLPRAAKGTVLRKAALNEYETEIEALYNLIEEKINMVKSAKTPIIWDSPSIQTWLLQLAADLANTTEISPNEDLFHQGFDSLSATFLRIHIIGAMRLCQDASIQNAAHDIAQNMVYSFPTISQLSHFIAGLVSGTAQDKIDQKEQIDKMVAKYTSGIGSPIASFDNTTKPTSVVLLTGSSGSLGSQILESLLQDNRVEKVYAFNRPSSASQTLLQRHEATFEDRGLDSCLLASPKLKFVEGRTHQENLGLDPGLYAEIRDSVTLIIHNAWQLDFNLSLSSFEPHILGTRRLVDLALASPRFPRFLFTSSVASAMSWTPAQGPCPEEILNDAAVAGGNGYGQSKFVAEQILAKSGLHSTCFRLGQVCGSLPKGAWATSDWIPILVKTSLALGRFPLCSGLVSVIDFKTATRAILDVSFSSEAGLGSHVFNLVHRRPVSWNFVITSIRDAIVSQQKSKYMNRELEMIPFSDWCRELELVPTSENVPGLKLLEFFRRLANGSDGPPDVDVGGICFATDKIQAFSSALRDADMISTESIEAWVGYWIAVGFL